ncbi:homeobox protein CDX-2 isoform X1 [Cricetulus griseus]|uniref:homeobox protein CDX-2 isoform X1 n=1 Tax=Cricetulus griseus TaxID=10029 RepID=UPI00022F39F1|nr:homeobox protein CDX-2 isoform X1 [Cricetulus griseus]
MYVSYLLDKDVSMYPSSVRHSGGLNLFLVGNLGIPSEAPGNVVSTVRREQNHVLEFAAAGIPYAAHNEKRGPWIPLTVPTTLSYPISFLHLRYPRKREVWRLRQDRFGHKGQFKGSALLQAENRRCLKTRTKDKYRVVYTDHQRLELEKEFHYSRYITIRRKAELAATLGLSERQVKIWFQNRRAKERKINKKKLQQQQQQQQQQQPAPPPPQPSQPQPGALRSVPEPLSPVSSLQGSVPGSVPGVLGPPGGVLNPTVTQ